MREQNRQLLIDTHTLSIEIRRSYVVPSVYCLEPYGGVRIECTHFHWGYSVAYEAPSIELLKTIGCLSSTIERKLALPLNKRRAGSASLDEDGEQFRLRRRPIKAQPNRIEFIRSAAHQTKAFSLPGVFELWSETAKFLELNAAFSRLMRPSNLIPLRRGHLELVINNE